MTQKNCSKKTGKIIQIDDKGVKDLGQIVRGTPQETLSAMLDAEADILCDAQDMSGAQAGKILRRGPKQNLRDYREVSYEFRRRGVSLCIL